MWLGFHNYRVFFFYSEDELKLTIIENNDIRLLR